MSVIWDDTTDLARESAVAAFTRMSPQEQEADRAFLRAREQARRAEAAHRQRELHVWGEGDYCWGDEEVLDPPTEAELQEWTEPDPFEVNASIDAFTLPLRSPARTAWHKWKKRAGSVGRRQRCGR